MGRQTFKHIVERQIDRRTESLYTSVHLSVCLCVCLFIGHQKDSNFFLIWTSVKINVHGCSAIKLMDSDRNLITAEK